MNKYINIFGMYFCKFGNENKMTYVFDGFGLEICFTNENGKKIFTIEMGVES